MIHNVAFTGREEMLTKVAKAAKETAVENAYEYVSASKLFSKEECQAVKEAIKKSQAADTFERRALEAKSKARYSSPFAPTETVATSRADETKLQTKRNVYLYNVAHGTPADIAEKNGEIIDVIL